jgi:hypothetical protein
MHDGTVTAVADLEFVRHQQRVQRCNERACGVKAPGVLPGVDDPSQERVDGIRVVVVSFDHFNEP